MRNKLKPCPFCGRKPVLKKCNNITPTWFKLINGYVVRCDKCEINGEWDEENIGATRNWNNRPIEDALNNALKRITREPHATTHEGMIKAFDTIIQIAYDAVYNQEKD